MTMPNRESLAKKLAASGLSNEAQQSLAALPDTAFATAGRRIAADAAAQPDPLVDDGAAVLAAKGWTPDEVGALRQLPKDDFLYVVDELCPNELAKRHHARQRGG